MIKRSELYRAVADKCDEPIGPTSKICLALLRELALIIYLEGQYENLDLLLRTVYREMPR